MVLRRSVAAVAVTLATFALTGCAAEDTLSSLNQNVDTAPPAAPVNIRTEALGASILLDWDASTEADVVGYDVFRYDPDPARESAYIKVNAATISASEFTVTEPTEQGTWYRVKAVDLSANRSSSSGAAYVGNGIYSPAAPEIAEEPGIELKPSR
jgi:hypothetical protein